MNWVETEKEAMVGDRQAVLQVVSALRTYREAVRKLLGARYADGECDSYSLHELSMVVQELEEEEET